MFDWDPSISTQRLMEEFATELLDKLPVLLGVDEIIMGCQLINADPYGVGLTTIPRVVTVALREYHQPVLYGGQVGLTVGDYYTVIHYRDGDVYEIMGTSGASGAYTAPPATYTRIVVASEPGEVVVASGEVVVI